MGPGALLINGLGLGDRTGAEGKGKLIVEVQGPNRKPQPQLLRPAYLKLFSEPVLEVEVGWGGEKGKETAWSLATRFEAKLTRMWAFVQERALQGELELEDLLRQPLGL